MAGWLADGATAAVCAQASMQIRASIRETQSMHSTQENTHKMPEQSCILCYFVCIRIE